MELAGRLAKRSLQLSSLDRTRVQACSERKGLIFLMLYKANLQERFINGVLFSDHTFFPSTLYQFQTTPSLTTINFVFKNV